MSKPDAPVPVRLLILSFYAPPDLCAGSFRIGGLFDALNGMGERVEAVCLSAMPNRYREFAVEAPPVETLGNVTLHRFALPAHDNGMRTQAMSYRHYAKGVMRHLRGKAGTYDAVFATSSRLMTASLGAHVSRKLDLPLYLDIRDLFRDTVSGLLTRRSARLGLLPALSVLEQRTLRRAGQINVVSAGFLDEVATVAPGVETRVFTNGIDPEFLDPLPPRPQGDRLRILYAGNIGNAQGLETVVPPVAAALGETAHFDIVGAGNRQPALVDALGKAGADNVTLHGPVPRAALRRFYGESDILFLHLGDQPAFRKVLPSKIFEYASLGLPILAGVAGTAADFLRREVPGTAVFDPGDAAGMLDGIDRLRPFLGTAIDRSGFRARYDRSRIMGDLAEDLVDFAAARRGIA